MSHQSPAQALAESVHECINEWHKSRSLGSYTPAFCFSDHALGSRDPRPPPKSHPSPHSHMWLQRTQDLSINSPLRRKPPKKYSLEIFLGEFICAHGNASAQDNHGHPAGMEALHAPTSSSSHDPDHPHSLSWQPRKGSRWNKGN